MLNKILKWLASKILPKKYEVRVAVDKKLEIEDGKAQLKNHEHDEAPKAVDHAKVERVGTLNRIDNYEAALRAQKNYRFRDDILQDPSLIGADTKYEAKLKLDIAAGEDISEKIDNNPKISESEIEDMLGTEWCARWGHNEFGDDLAAEINDPGSTQNQDKDSSHSTGFDSDSSHESSTSGSDSEETGSTPSEGMGNSSGSEPTQVSINTDSGSVTTKSGGANADSGANEGGGLNQ